MSDNEVNLDLNRYQRIGLEEAIFCTGKTDDQLDVILARILENKRSCLLTRLSSEKYQRLDAKYRTLIDYDEMTGSAFFNWHFEQRTTLQVGVVTAGSSDVPVAKEAMRTLEYFGVTCVPVFDVGVAGIHRLLNRIDEIRQFPILIAAAGMDAALPSVLGGLYPGLLIAIPTSVGYGVAAGGSTALNSILASCASGIVTVNIDNGYGAGCAAMRALGLVNANSEATDAVVEDSLLNNGD